MDPATLAPTDVAVVGAGAAGLATAIFTARGAPAASVAALDGARLLGAKILVSGGGRCNVTNTVVTEADFWGGSPHVVRRVLDAFPAEAAAAFFRDIGVPLHEEEGGKLFPDTHRARTVLDALLDEARRRGVRVLPGHRVHGVSTEPGGFRLDTGRGTLRARHVVLATGGLSLPKTGSDGAGYRLARHLGHSVVPTTPALAPLVLDGGFHERLKGVAQNVELTLRAPGRKPFHLTGAMLWTHFGVSGPAALDVSRHWLRASAEGRAATLTARLAPDGGAGGLDGRLVALSGERPRLAFRNALGTLLPAAVVAAVLARLEVNGEVSLARLRGDDRRRVARAVEEWVLPVRSTRGYDFAEVTAGGVPLVEVDARTLESRRCPGLYLVGEILDVDGRIGGFNFQWAWSSAWGAARGLASRLAAVDAGGARS